jgi:hypothetical protein
LTVVEAVYQVEIAGAAASGANGQPPCEMGFGAGGKGGRLFVPDVHPLEIAPLSDCIGDAIEGVAGNSVDIADSGLC